LNRFHGLLRSPDTPEPVSSVTHWGKRTLAFPIKRREVGYYVVTRIEAQPDQLTELERVIKLDDGVLRHLTVVNEGLAPAGATPAEAEGAERPDRDEEDDE
jgi:ribosomal protein S6